jgi:hypothetical protein
MFLAPKAQKADISTLKKLPAETMLDNVKLKVINSK